MNKILIIITLGILFSMALMDTVWGQDESMGNIPPTVTIICPTYGQEPPYYNCSGTASDSDGAIEKVEVKLGEQGEWLLATGTTQWYINYSETYNFGLTVGAWILYARSYDGTNYSDTISVRFPVGNVQTYAKIVSPVNNDTVSGTIIIRGTASDLNGNDTIQGITIFIDEWSRDRGQGTVANGTINWTCAWDTTTVKNGIHTIIAEGYDGIEHATTFHGIRVMVDNKNDNDIAGFEVLLCFTGIAMILVLKRRQKNSN